MAVTFATLYARLGRLMSFGVTVRASQATLRTQYEDTMSNYTDADRDMVKTITSSIEQRIDEAGRIVSDLVSDSNHTLIEMVDDDTTISSLTTESSLRELIRQMVTATSSIDRPGAGYVSLPTGNKGTAGAINTGNGIMLANDHIPLQGFSNDPVEFLDWPSIRTEKFRSSCIRDSTSKNVQEGSEAFLIEGERKVPNLDEDWPKGTATRGSVQVATPNRDGGRGPMLNVAANSDFQQFTSNVPDNWTLVAGTAGTHVYASGAAGFGPASGANSLRFVGDGSTNPNIKQTLRTTAGSLGEVNPDRPYTISAAVKYATARPTSILEITVRDSGGTVLNDSVVGRQMKLQAASADIGTSYAIFSAICFAPPAIGKGAYIDIRFSGNQANTSQVFVSDVVIAEMQTFGRGGLAFQMIGGATRYAEGDEFTLQATNNCDASNGVFATEFERFFSLGKSYGLAMPSSTSPSVADSLVS